MYIPMNILTLWIIENKGLKACITVGCFIMIFGSVLRFLGGVINLWIWFIGHVLSLCSSSFLKTPCTKLASNWFGDKERGVATAIGYVSGPLGIFISKILILTIFDDKDKEEEKDGGNKMDVTTGRI